MISSSAIRFFTELAHDLFEELRSWELRSSIDIFDNDRLREDEIMISGLAKAYNKVCQIVWDMEIRQLEWELYETGGRV